MNASAPQSLPHLAELTHLDLGPFHDGQEHLPARRIACLVRAASVAQGKPGAVWLPGLKSNMISTKASALDAWCAEQGRGLLRLDYSGHGQSSGRFEDGRVGAWLEEAEAAVSQLTKGPQVLVGSSTGGYIALLMLARAVAGETDLSDRIAGLVLIAPAWDLTQTLMWDQFPPSARRAIEETGVYLRPSTYGDGPYALTRGLIEEGKRHLLSQRPFDPGRPVYVLHGLIDDAVPFEHTLELDALLLGDRLSVEMIPDGDHRLAREDDIAKLLDRVARF